MTAATEDRQAAVPTMNGYVRLIRLPEVKALTGLSRSTLYERIKEGRFPRPINLGGRSVGWLEGEVNTWIANQISASRGRPG